MDKVYYAHHSGVYHNYRDCGYIKDVSVKSADRDIVEMFNVKPCKFCCNAKGLSKWYFIA